MKPKTLRPRQGLLAGGLWQHARIKVIDAYPPAGQTAQILSEVEVAGGGAGPVLQLLAAAGANFPLAGAGLVGKDASGAALLAECRRHKIDVRHLGCTPKASTAYTEILSESRSGRRTVFQSLGASALWPGAGLNFKPTTARWFHFSALLAGTALDEPDEEFGIRAGRLLAAAQAAGLKTSAEVSAKVSGREVALVRPGLKFLDYLLVDEVEAGLLAGFSVRTATGQLDPVTLRHAAGALLQQGVREFVIIHFPEGALARNRRGEDFWQPALKLPARDLVSSTGAGQAFTAGVLWGGHEGWEINRSLLTGVCLAAATLTTPVAPGGGKSLRHALALARKYGFQRAVESGLG